MPESGKPYSKRQLYEFKSAVSGLLGPRQSFLDRSNALSAKVRWRTAM